jgi:amino acid transporter
LIGEAYTPTSAALETLVVLALQAALIITSTRATTRVNNTAVATEVIGIVGLTVLLIIVAAIRGLGHWSNLGSTGVVSPVGYYGWLGPFMLATLLGAYTIVGFESASNLTEETFEPHKTVPRAMVQAVVLSGVVGMAFLIALVYAIDSIPAVSSSAAPVALIVQDVLGGFVQKIFLIFVCVSIFACGLVIMVTNGRMIWSMSRDRRLPGYQLWRRVPRATGGPTWATILGAVIGAVITLVLRTHTSALVTLFTASTIMPALLYASTVVLYIFTARRHRAQAGHFSLGARAGRARRAGHPRGEHHLPVDHPAGLRHAGAGRRGQTAAAQPGHRDPGRGRFGWGGGARTSRARDGEAGASRAPDRHHDRRGPLPLGGERRRAAQRRRRRDDGRGPVHHLPAARRAHRF